MVELQGVSSLWMILCGCFEVNGWLKTFLFQFYLVKTSTKVSTVSARWVFYGFSITMICTTNGEKWQNWLNGKKNWDNWEKGSVEFFLGKLKKWSVQQIVRCDKIDSMEKFFWENWEKRSADVEFFWGKTVKNDLYNKIERYDKID